MSPGSLMTGGALITAAFFGVEKSFSPSLPAGIGPCSLYVPAQTRIVSPGLAAVTAAWIEVKSADWQSAPLSSTVSWAAKAGPALSASAAAVVASAHTSARRARAVRASLMRPPGPGDELRAVPGSGYEPTGGGVPLS